MKAVLLLSIIFCIPGSIFQQTNNPFEERELIHNYINFSSETIPLTNDFQNSPQYIDTIIDNTTTHRQHLPVQAPDNTMPFNMPVITPDTSMQNYIPQMKIPEEYQMEQNKAPKYDGPIFLEVEEMPKFSEGGKALKNYIAEHIKYPSEAYVKGIEGTVYVQFIVNKSGQVKEPIIQKGVTPALDKEAIRVVQSLPAWRPGKQNGFEVNVLYTLPIEFKLQHIDR